MYIGAWLPLLAAETRRRHARTTPFIKFDNTMNTLQKKPLADSYFMGNHFCLIRRYKLAFVAIAKNAVTYLKNLAVYTNTGVLPAGMDSHRIVGYKEPSPYLCPLSRMKQLENQAGAFTKFAVWRDPVERLVSCYKLFCLEKEPRLYFHYLNLNRDSGFDRFMQFVEFELGKKDPVFQDEHIRRQCDYYRPDQVDYIVPIRKLRDFLQEQGIAQPEQAANVTHVPFRLENEAHIRRIRELYSDDYLIIPNY